MTAKKKKKNDLREESIRNNALASAGYEKVQTYGSAAKQHYVAYSGLDNETGQALTKGLKSIAHEKVNPQYEYQNIHQQAGFSAEVKDVARTNAENIIKGDPTRKVRTDDIGRVNDPLYDTVRLDASGNVIDESGVQMKFYGASQNDPNGANAARRALSKLQSKKCEKYFENDVKVEVPSDQYDKILEEADTRIGNLNKQLQRQKANGNINQEKIIQEKINKLERIKKNLRKSTVSSEEAEFSRLHPVLSTAADVGKLSHRAGVETAKQSAVIAGSISIVKNLVGVMQGDIDPDEAFINVAKDTGTAALVGYGTGFAGAAIKGLMQNAKGEAVKNLAKTNLAATIVSFGVSAGKTFQSYFDGEITGDECMNLLGEQAVGTVASSVCAAIGQAVIPIPVVGSMIGGMVGYALSTAAYRVLKDAMDTYTNIAEKERKRIEKECEEHIKMIREYRANLEHLIRTYLIDSMTVFEDSFDGIKAALDIGDIDGVIRNSNAITEAFGGRVPFRNKDDFENKMKNQVAFKL